MSLFSAGPIARYLTPLLGVSRRFSRHNDGATTIEYGLICVFIGLAVLAGMQVFGSTLMQAYPKIVSFPSIQ
ncbi:Flp family type IVb pilin [Methylorubrum populi]|uniref:Flp family type IVb pilin n=1 Tax=Methylorubrum populi TaxID=223967 RepID=UPI000BBA5760|nr:Flp family type IVb pilin [Methylorubrum populi]